MITDVITFLEADASLQTLLNSNAGNRKFFALAPKRPGERTPYIIYSSVSEGSGDNVLEESMIQFSIRTEKFDDARQIAYRLSELLDVWENLSITSTNFHIYYSRKVGGADSTEEDTDLINMTRIFHFKYKRKTGG